jgi:hypothetical protein
MLQTGLILIHRIHPENDPEIKELESLHDDLMRMFDALVLERMTDAEAEKMYHQIMGGEPDPLVDENWKIPLVRYEFREQRSTWDYKSIRA